MPAIAEKSARETLADLLTESAAIEKAIAATESKQPTPEQSDRIVALSLEVEKAEQAVADEDKAAAERVEKARAKLSGSYAEASKPQPRRAGAGSHEPIVAKEGVLNDPRRGFKSLADFALEIANCGPSLSAVEMNPRLRAAAGTGMTQGVTADGGVLVPPAFSTEIFDGARQQSNSMLQYCDVRMIDPGVQSVTFPGVDETSRANGSRWGGIRGYWKSELTAMTESKPKFREVRVEPQELYVLGYVSDKLLRHAPAAASSILAKAAADEINFKVGDAIVEGDGSGKPRGYLGHDATVSVTRNTASHIVKQDIDKMWGRFHPNWIDGAVWFVNKEVDQELQSLAANVGVGGLPAYLPPGGLNDSPYARLKGRPVIVIEYAEALGTVGDITLANLGAYLVALRGMVDQSVSMHLKFDYAQTAYRFIFEVDGQPWLASAMTPFKGSSTLSPIVNLTT